MASLLKRAGSCLWYTYDNPACNVYNVYKNGKLFITLIPLVIREGRNLQMKGTQLEVKEMGRLFERQMPSFGT
jgi:hypothetical protein